MAIGDYIYNRRKDLGLTLEEVGRAVGVAKSTVRKWEVGLIENMRIDKLEKLAQVLETTVDTLLNKGVSIAAELPESQEETVKRKVLTAARLDNVQLTKEEEQSIMDFIKYTISKRDNN